MRVQELLSALHQEAARRVYVVRLEILDQTSSLVKARLYISPDLFVQVYRNDPGSLLPQIIDDRETAIFNPF